MMLIILQTVISFQPLQFSMGAYTVCVAVCSKPKHFILFLINLLPEKVIGCPWILCNEESSCHLQLYVYLLSLLPIVKLSEPKNPSLPNPCSASKPFLFHLPLSLPNSSVSSVRVIPNALLPLMSHDFAFSVLYKCIGFSFQINLVTIGMCAHWQVFFPSCITQHLLTLSFVCWFSVHLPWPTRALCDSSNSPSDFTIMNI